MRLAAFQQQVQAAILSPVLDAADAELAIKTGPRAHACSRYRIAIHHDHFWTRMRDFTAYRYPLLARAVGADLTAIVRAFIAAHPPTSVAIGGIVERLPAFLAGHAPWAGAPILAELAGFDFCRSGLRAAAEEPTVSHGDLAALSFAALERTRLRLKRRAGVATTRYRFDLARIHELPRDAALGSPTYWLVHIAGGASRAHVVGPRVYAALERLAAGIAIGDVVGAFQVIGLTPADSDAIVDRCVCANLLVAEAR